MRRNFPDKHAGNSYFCLRIDVDTYTGLKVGLPRLLSCLDDLEIKASIFIPAGPDRSGLAVKRAFSRPGFLKRMIQLNAPRIYSPRIFLAGTLLPPKYLVPESAPLIIPAAQRGHEAGLHGYDHFSWQDRVNRLEQDQITDLIHQGCAEFQRYLDIKPVAFAAPGWVSPPPLFKALDSFGFAYASDCRGTHPFYPQKDGYCLSTLQLPTNLPTLDELLIRVSENRAYQILENHRKSQTLSIHTIHAEVEGRHYFAGFQKWLNMLKNQSVCFLTMGTLSHLWSEKYDLSRAQIEYQKIPGRYDRIAVQGADIS